MTSDPFIILLRHNHWANGVILNRCSRLSEEQFHRKFEIGLGSLHDTLDHIFGVMEAWIAHVRGEEYPDWYEKQSLEQLRRRFEASTSIMQQLLEVEHGSGGLSREVTFYYPLKAGGTARAMFTVAAMITHALVHGTHHRAQALNMLRQLDLGEPLPDLDISDWQFETENAKA